MVSWKPFWAWIPVTGQPLRGFFLCTIPSTGTELCLSVRDVWVRLGWAGIVSWAGVGTAQSWLDCTFPSFSVRCWTGNKQSLFVKYRHRLCTLQPQLWPLANSGETTAVGTVNSEGMINNLLGTVLYLRDCCGDELLFVSLLSNLSVSSLPSATNNNYYYFCSSSAKTHKWSPVIGTVQNRT